LLACGALSVGAQQDLSTLQSWRVTRYAGDGLRSPIITSLAESESGRLWVSTASGIAWFDGWMFHEGRTEPNTLNRAALAIRPMRGDSVAVLMNNVLYVGDTTGFKQRAIRGPTDTTEQQVRDAVWTTEGLLLLIGIESRRDTMRLMRWDGDRTVELASPASLGGRDVTSLHPAPDGGAWLNTAAGLFRLSRGGWRLHLPSGGVAMRVTRLVENARGEVVAGVAGGAGGSGVWQWRHLESPRRVASEGDDELLAVASNGSTGFLAAHRGGYLRRADGGRWSPYGSGIALDVRTALRDRDGDLWVGTGQGLLLVRESATLWSGVPQGFPSLRDRVNALAWSPEGALWAGTADGIDVFERDGRIRHLGRAAGIPLRTITALARDSSGNMWVGSGSGLEGALRWDGRTWTHFGRDQGLGAEHVHRIVVSRAGAVWFLGIGSGADGAQTDPGAFVLDSGRFRHVGTEDGLPSGHVYDYAEARDGTQWFGTTGGLSRRRNGEWTHWRDRRGRTATRAFRATPIRVFTLDVDASGTPWFADANGEFPYGIGTLEADTLRFYNVNDGLLGNAVQSVRVGPDGAVWAGTVNGLSVFHNGVWYRLGTDRGLGFPQIWPLLVDDSSVVIGTLGGGVRRLSLTAARTPAPRVLVPPPTIGAGVVNVSWTPLAWRGSLPSPLIETRLRVDGGPWRAWTIQRSAVLELSGGSHAVELQAKGLYAPVDGPIARVAFDVPGPLVTRPEFYVPVGALLLLLVALSVTSVRRERRDANVLRESEGRFRALAASTSEGIAIAVDGRIVDANEQLHRMLRVADGSLRDRPAAELSFPSGAVATATAGESVPVTIRRDDGSSFPAEVVERAAPYFGSEARVTAIRDLTEREKADRALRESEERFETLFRKSPTPITLTSWPDGRLVEVSEGFESVTGIGRDEAIGRTPIELALYSDRSQREELFSRLAEHGRVRGIELTVRRREGSARDFIGTFQQLELDGRPHVLGVLTDITERRTLEAQLLQSQKMEAVGRLAGGVAHDFNNLLTVILGHADMLRHTVADEEDRADIAEIHEAAKRASDLTRQLLTFARKQRISPQVLELGEVIPRVQRLLARLLGERIAVESRLAADVPHVVMDPGQLEQVLVNLAVNARDAMPDGGLLTIEAQPVELGPDYVRENPEVTPGRYALITVSDTGVGIPAEVLPSIFEPFFTTKDVGQGTGLGLAICYGIVREAGGHITVQSEIGRGTSMRIHLPMHDGEPRSAASVDTRSLSGGDESILVVEDEPLVRSLVERVLRSLGYRVAGAADYAQAMELLPTIDPPPRLLLSDVVLPGPGGPEIAKAVRERIPGIAVLYMSGYTERGANSTTDLDAPLLAKPFTPELLASAVRESLDRA